MYQEDTISAVTTPLGLGAVGIVRLSGPSSLALAEQMFRPASGKPFRSYAVRTMVYGTVVDETGAPVDEVLCVYMKAPHSYTAEDVVEFQCHGGTACAASWPSRTATGRGLPSRGNTRAALF